MSRSMFSWCVVAIALFASELTAQRGRRRSEEILERVGTYIGEAKLPAAEEGKDRLASVSTVADAVQKKELSVLYLFDTANDVPKRQQFEAVVFGSEEVGVAMRCFHFARVDLAGDTDMVGKYGKKLPVFVMFDEHGKPAGEVSFAGYKATINPLTDALGKAAAGHVKPTLALFVSDYREFVRELEVTQQQRKTLAARIEGADPSKRPALEKDAADLEAREKKLLATEKDLLEKAKVPERSPDAKRFEPPRRGRG
jgi:hypothetical protein